MRCDDFSLGTLSGMQEPAEVSLGSRSLALLIDWIIALMLTAVVTGSNVLGSGASNPLLPIVVFFVQAWLLTGLLGMTIGKRLLRIRVINAQGGAIGLGRAAVRSALLCLVVPALVMTEDKRGLHDLAAGSKVVPA